MSHLVQILVTWFRSLVIVEDSIHFMSNGQVGKLASDSFTCQTNVEIQKNNRVHVSPFRLSSPRITLFGDSKRLQREDIYVYCFSSVSKLFIHRNCIQIQLIKINNEIKNRKNWISCLQCPNNEIISKIYLELYRSAKVMNPWYQGL